MTNPYGPWATAIDAGRNPQLSAFWRQRLTMLVPTSQTSPTLSRRIILGLVASAALLFALPTFHAAPAVAEQGKVSAEADKKAKDPKTVQANKQVTSYHVKITPAAELGEAWVQLNPDGTALRARMDLLSPQDGAKVVILSDGKAEIWFKDKNGHTFVPAKDALKRIAEMRDDADPKFAFEQLQAAQKAGKARVESKEPAKEGEPVTLTATSKDTPDRRQVYELDPKTKLVARVTDYRRHSDKWEQVSLRAYLDYDKPIDPKVFKLDLPKDVVTVDQIQRKPGLVKGKLTDEEMAKKVTREFFEALIAEDYDKAGLIYSGIPAEKFKELSGGTKIFRIVEMGKPVPAPDPRMKALQVPVKVEWEVKHRKWVKAFSATVRLTDAEKAAKTVREFYQAVIRGDEKTADRIFQATGMAQRGVTRKDVKKRLKELAEVHVKLLRIVEIGKPVPHPENGTTEVPVKIEGEQSVGKEVRQFAPFVRAVYGQPDRWAICGGF